MKKDTGYRNRKETISSGKVRKKLYLCQSKKKGKRRDKPITQRRKLRSLFGKILTDMKKMSQIMKTRKVKIMEAIKMKNQQKILKETILKID